MHLSCNAIGVKAAQREAIDYAARYGFDSVDADAVYLAGLTQAERENLLAHMRDRKVGWGLSGLTFDFRKDDALFREGIRTLPDLAKVLKAVGVQRVTTWLSPTHADRTYRINFQTHVSRLGEVARVLADQDLRFGMEYVGPKLSWTAQRYPFVHTLAEMKELIAEIGQPNVGVVLDSWHWWNAGEGVSDLSTLTNRDVISVDLNDAPAGLPREQQVDSQRELPLATGAIDAQAFLAALVKIRFDGPIRAEPFNAALRALPPEQALQKTAASMKKAFATVTL